MDTPIFEKAIHLLVDTLRDELRSLAGQVDELRLELQKKRLSERARRLQAELGFRGDLGWQCLRCGQDFRTLRDAETHLFLSSHCRKCGRALPEATTAAASALCEFCSSAFMQARLKKRLKKQREKQNTVLVEDDAFTEDSLQFRECHPCSSKPGAPELCASCFHNRRAIELLVRILNELAHEPTAAHIAPIPVGGEP